MAPKQSGRARRPAEPGRLMAIAGGLATVAALGAFVIYHRGEQQAADAAVLAQWMVDGAPCTAMTAAEAAAVPRRPDKVIELPAARIARSYGDGTCREFEGGLRDRLGARLICQFSGPGWLAIGTQAGETHFAARGGATVSVGEGAPRCIQATNLRSGVSAP